MAATLGDHASQPRYQHLHSLASAEFAAPQPPFPKESRSPCGEKQIVVDTFSLKHESSLVSKRLPPIKTSGWHGLFPPLSPAKSKFLSYSLPNSATSSPRFAPINILLEKMRRATDNGQGSPPPQQLNFDTLVMMNPYLAVQQEMRNFRRSKSCGDGRASTPCLDFDLALVRQAKAITGSGSSSSDGGEYHHYVVSPNHRRFSGSEDDEDSSKMRDEEGRKEEFKCGALCLFIAGFGKAKPVKPKKESPQPTKTNWTISRTVSLEKFECGSWASSAINLNNDDGGGVGDISAHLYFDLPLEMIRTTVNDTHSPVTTAFIFDEAKRKGVLKNSSTRTPDRKSHEIRHVRFSTSSPTSCPGSPSSCITPRLRKAREDFNAFLEAQSA